MTKLKDIDPDEWEVPSKARLWRWFWASTLVIALVVLGGWQLGWWFHGQNVSREARVNQRSYGRQVSLRDDISAKLGTISDITVQLTDPSIATAQRGALKAQLVSVVRIVCQDAALINQTSDLPADQQRFLELNCSGGAMSVGSEYRK